MPSESQVRPRAKSIGHYVLGKTIGEGTFGKVKLGTHILTGERAAVKVLEKERIVEVADVERVAREVHILKLIRHPHVVQLYEIIETRKQLYLIMEYASGGELFDYIVASGRVQEAEACRFFHQIIAGVEKVHAMNIVHRDLKPENLLLDEHRNIKIVDFGLSNVYRDGQLLKTACGSPCYAAPEMIAGHSYVPSLCDLWSCGVILFALVCGYLPFEDQNTATLYKKILAADYRPPRFISDSVKDLIAGLLTTEPTRRFTIPVVRSHPWCRQIPEASVKPHDLAPDQNGLEEDVLRELDAFGFPRDYAVRCLEVNKHNHVTTTYYLLAEKKRRMMARLDRLLPGELRNLSVDGRDAEVHPEGPVGDVAEPPATESSVHQEHAEARHADETQVEPEVPEVDPSRVVPCAASPPAASPPATSPPATGTSATASASLPATAPMQVAAPSPTASPLITSATPTQTFVGEPCLATANVDACTVAVGRAAGYPQAPATWTSRDSNTSEVRQRSAAPDDNGTYPSSGTTLPRPSSPSPTHAHSPQQLPFQAISGTKPTETATPRRRSPVSSGSYLNGGSPASILERLYGASGSTAPGTQSVASENGQALQSPGVVPSSATTSNSYRRPTSAGTGSAATRIFGKDPPTKVGSMPTKRTSVAGATNPGASSSATRQGVSRGAPTTPRDLMKPTESARRRTDLTVNTAPQSARARLGARPAVPITRPTGPPLSARERNSTRANSASPGAPMSARAPASPAPAASPSSPSPSLAPSTPARNGTANAGSGAANVAANASRAWQSWTPGRPARLSPR